MIKKMTNEWIDWSDENRIRTPLRGAISSCNNLLNNNYTNCKFGFGMGLKANTVMKSSQRPKGKKFHWLAQSITNLSFTLFFCAFSMLLAIEKKKQLNTNLSIDSNDNQASSSVTIYLIFMYFGEGFCQNHHHPFQRCIVYTFKLK